MFKVLRRAALQPVAPGGTGGAEGAIIHERPARRPKFYPNLEPIRGIAAMSVVLIHCVNAFEAPNHATGFDATLLNTFWDAVNGQNAVILFFVLSGFVLFDSIRGERTSLRLFFTFLIKRCFRILPVAYMALALGAVFLFLVVPGKEILSQGAPWFVDGFGPATGFNLATNFLFLGYHVDVVYWTLYIELVASLLFVPLAWFATAFRWPVQVVLQAGLLLMCYVMYGRSWAGLYLHPLASFLTYFFCFHLGILTNRFRILADDAEGKIGRHRLLRLGDVVASVIGVYLVCYGHSRIAEALPPIAASILGPNFSLYGLVVPIEAFGACLVVYGCSGQYSRVTNWILQSRVLKYLGRLSFGIYTIHLIIVKAAFVCLAAVFGSALTEFPLLGPLLAIILVVPSAIALAHFMNVYIEVPAIRLARMLVGRPRRSTDAQMVVTAFD